MFSEDLRLVDASAGRGANAWCVGLGEEEDPRRGCVLVEGPMDWGNASFVGDRLLEVRTSRSRIEERDMVDIPNVA